MTLRLRLTGLLLALCLTGCAGAQDAPLSREAFTAAFIEALRARAPELRIETAGPMLLEISEEDEEGPASIFLNNTYDRYLAAPDQKDTVIADLIASSLESFPVSEDEIDVSRIVPVIKDTAYLDDVRQTQESRGREFVPPAHERYNAALVVLYAEDKPSSIRYIPEGELEKIGAAGPGLRARAVENLRALLPEIELHVGDGIYMLTAGGSYEASLLLLDHIWQGGQVAVKGELVAAVPARDMLLVTGSEDPAGLKTVKEIVRDIMRNGAYRLTDRLFVYRDGRFVVFDD